MWEQRVGYLAWEREDGVAVSPGNPGLLGRGLELQCPHPALVGYPREPEARRCVALVFHGSRFSGSV